MGDLLAKNLRLKECDHSSLKEYATFHFAYYRLEWGAPQQELYSSLITNFSQSSNPSLSLHTP
jgi:hypothetical protein